MNHDRWARPLGFLFLVEALLGLVPVAVLGAAIGWPASLALPVDQVLPALAAHLGEVRLGYGVYALYSLLFWPLVVGAARWAGLSASPIWFGLVAGAAALSTLARLVGILRWLTAAPLAASSSDPWALSAFATLNAYGGAIGEVLGIALLGGLAVGGFSLWLLTQKDSVRWLGWWGLVVGLVQLTGVVPLFGVDLGPVTTVSAVSLMTWFVAVGLKLSLSRGR